MKHAQIIRRNFSNSTDGIRAGERALISLLFITSLFPAIIPHDSMLRYGPLFTMLFITAIVAVLNLNDSVQRARLTSFLLVNKLLIAIVGLYSMAIIVSALVAGSLRDAPYVLGSILAISILLVYIPRVVRQEGDFFFLMKLLFVIGVSNAAVAWILLALKWFYGYGFGIFPVSQFGSNKLTILEHMRIPYVMKGLFWHPNFLGILLSFILPSGLFLAKQAKDMSQKLIYTGGSILSCITIAGACAFISLLPAFLTLTLYPVITKKRISDFLSLFMILSVLTVTIVVFSKVDLTQLKSLPFMPMERVERWDAAIPLISEHAFWGVGPSHAAEHLPNQMTAHNTFIDVALAYGLPAMTLYSALFILLTISIRRSIDKIPFPFMMLTHLSFFILQFFETQFFGGMSIANFYFLILVISYLSMSSEALQERHIKTERGSAFE